MALTTIPTFTPSGFMQIVAPPPAPPTDPTGGFNLPPYYPKANTLALVAGSAPDKVIITNLGPDPAVVLLTTAAGTTTGTAAVGASVVAVASASGIAVGNAAIGAGVAEGSIVKAISGLNVTLDRPVVAALSSTTVNFVIPVTLSSGIAVTPNNPPIALAYGANTFISAIQANGAGRSVLNVAVGV